MKYLEIIYLFFLYLYILECVLKVNTFKSAVNCTIFSLSLSSEKKKSLIQCLEECLKNDFCRVVAYNKNTTECIMDTSRFNS